MCGRHDYPNYPKSWRELHALLDLYSPEPPDTGGQAFPSARGRIITTEAPHELVEAEWGLRGDWERSGANLSLFNARTEKLEGPFWRKFHGQRCLVPSGAYYEWRKIEGSKKKQKFKIGLKDTELCSFAGFWNRWEDALSYTILTTGSNDLIRPIHDRMPVILPREHWKDWLDPSRPMSELKPLLVPYDSDLMFTEVVPEPAKVA